jgi:hypothetical protein
MLNFNPWRVNKAAVSFGSNDLYEAENQSKWFMKKRKLCCISRPLMTLKSVKSWAICFSPSSRLFWSRYQ